MKLYQAISNLIASKLYDNIKDIQKYHSVAFRLHSDVKTKKGNDFLELEDS